MPGGTLILRGLGGERKPVKETEKEQPVRLEKNRTVWGPGSQVKAMNQGGEAHRLCQMLLIGQRQGLRTEHWVEQCGHYS